MRAVFGSFFHLIKRKEVFTLENKNLETCYSLTTGALAVIESVVNRTKITDPQKLVPEVCEELVNRYGSSAKKGDRKLDYHLKQMRLSTTRDIARAIDCFFIAKQLFPGKCYA